MPSLNINQNSIVTPDWPITQVLAFQTTRLHPFASKPSIHTGFDHFNLGLHVNDNPTQVQQNRADILKLLGSKSQIQWLNQVHGNQVHQATHFHANTISADAQITCQPNLALAIMTADCLPILLTNSQGTEVAAIHAGWRSLAGGIIKNTLTNMSSTHEQLYAWLGPCIQQPCFEVGQEVKQQFLAVSTDLAHSFIAKGNNKYLADLPTIAGYLLQQQGVKHIYQTSDCTYSQPDKYYSYRRQAETGRMASIIMIKNPQSS